MICESGVGQRAEWPNPAEVTRLSLKPAEKRLFLLAGYVHLEDLWTDDFSQALADEARSRWRCAEVPRTGPRTPMSDTPPRPISVANGPVLSSLHFAMVGLVRALSGRLLVPSFSAYGYYEVDDRVLLHLDTDRCDITLLTTAFGEVGPLHVHAELRGMTMEELGVLESDPAWYRAGGVPVLYPTRGLLALSGGVLPHNRPGKPVAGLSAVAALCYRSLF